MKKLILFFMLLLVGSAYAAQTCPKLSGVVSNRAVYDSVNQIVNCFYPNTNKIQACWPVQVYGSEWVHKPGEPKSNLYCTGSNCQIFPIEQPKCSMLTL